MISIRKDELETYQKFLNEVVEDFNKNPELTTYGDCNPGGLFAVRWGLDGNCVLVFSIDEYKPIINFTGAVTPGKAKTNFPIR